MDMSLEVCHYLFYYFVIHFFVGVVLSCTYTESKRLPTHKHYMYIYTSSIVEMV